MRGAIRSWPLVVVALIITGCASRQPSAPRGAPLAVETPVRGWTILSDSEPDNLAVIKAAPAYNINHLQLSHHLVHDLREIKNPMKRRAVNRLIDEAHRQGITEVVLWDHALYPLNYYPIWFRTGPKYTIDLDNPRFWEWLKADYRRMLDKVPNANGIVLTFIETGARAEQQHSKKLKTPQEKIAAVVNAVADVVIEERGLNLYARTFSYTYEETDNILKAVELFENPKIRVMIKEVPHDFFLTHPNDPYVGKIPRPTLVEFDAAGEYNGQGIIAGTWPQYILGRWKDLGSRPHVIGYTARTDRYGDTRMIGTANEINLLALKRGAEDPSVSAEQIYDEFITTRYGQAALPHLKPAFKNAYDIVSCSLYTLGTLVSNHSALNYDPYASSFVRMVSGKWIDPPTTQVAHGIDREFHYWKDVIDHIAPPFAKVLPKAEDLPATAATAPTTAPKRKKPAPTRWDEVPDVIRNGWIRAGEQMNEEFLRYIVTEKNHGVRLAEQSLAHIEDARPHLKPADYEHLHHLFTRTLLTARLHRAVASAYYGYRVWYRGESFRSEYVTSTTRAGLDEILDVAQMIYDYPVEPPKGQWNWRQDANIAWAYFRAITRGTWQKQTDKANNPYSGIAFPYHRPTTRATVAAE